MKQVFQSIRDGKTQLIDVPCPAVAPGSLLIRTSVSLISAGTERMLVEFGKSGWIEKARQQPDKVRMVLDKVKTDGLGATIDAVLEKLDRPLALGYCNVGVVVDVGSGVEGFAIGDRVLSNGHHAELVVVPKYLCARLPEHVSDEDAAFAVLASIALQGLRLLQPTLGESICVTGLGIIGLLAVRLARAHGCRVFAVDSDASRLQIARESGAETFDISTGQDPVAAAREFSRGRGMDGVLIAASTQSNEPMHQAAQACRKRGRIVLVGVTGLQIERADFYDKELTFQVSCSYGPGRYDPSYEIEGRDYPIGFVRWTEQRNFEAVLDMMSDGRMHASDLITHKFPFEDALDGYSLLSSKEKSLGILLRYSPADDISKRASRISITARHPVSELGPASSKPVAVAFIGAGNYASAVLAPAFKRAGAKLRVSASRGGATAAMLARKHGFDEATTDTESVLEDPSVDAVVIATRHDSHARLAIRALRAGKHVFVEKPLALCVGDLQEIADAANATDRVLTCGFNRRFAPHVVRMRSMLEHVRAPKALVVTVNAGNVPDDHWTQSEASGGGRIVGEACHHIDLLRFLVGSPIAKFQTSFLRSTSNDTATLQFVFADGSIGTVHYFSNGSKRYPKERVEVFAEGRVLCLDNYRRLDGFGWGGFRASRLWRQNKGQDACVSSFLSAASGTTVSPIRLDELIEVSGIAIEVASDAKRSR